MNDLLEWDLDLMVVMMMITVCVSDSGLRDSDDFCPDSPKCFDRM